jgi:hypothetical protein
MSSTIRVFKSLIEQALKRSNTEEVANKDFWITMLKAAIQYRCNKVYVYADALRFYEDFKEKSKIDCRFADSGNLIVPGVRITVIVLCTGGRTDRQREMFQEFMKRISPAQTDIWYIGQW